MADTGTDMKAEKTEAEKQEALKKIDEKMDAAQILVEEAVKIAKEAGVVFHVSIANMRNTYVPKGGGVDEYGDEYEGGYDAGWQSSSC